ncbi:hypothetical protein ANO11243_023780 [Dothideomycetidae sp. 11243]|nr:hypothetical protein ANO11243_023780 [fungal sp. No.11243]
MTALNHIPEEYEPQFHESETPDNATLASDAYGDDYGDMSQFTNPRKRKRMEDVLTPQDEQHQLWAEELLDYFMLLESPSDPFHRPPNPPPGINLDRPIDDKGHTALHWAAAMGDTSVVRDLISRGASIDCLSKSGETPLMRAVIFTNSFDKQTMEKIAGWLIQTVAFTEWFGSTVFHHIAATTSSKSKYACARYYLDAILNRMAEIFSPMEIEKILNIQDRAGDTAITIAARNGARKCVRGLIGRNAAVDIPNDAGETADELIVQLNHRRRDGRHRQLSSSPFQLDPNINGNSHLLNGSINGSRIVNLAHNPLMGSSPSLFPQEAQPRASEASKSAKLAASYDAEIGEKETEVTELERVVRGRKEEIDGLKRGVRDLVMRDQDDQTDARLCQQLDALVQQVETQREAAQKGELDRLMHEEMASPTSSSSNAKPADGNLPNGHKADHTSGDDDKEQLIRRIAEMQSARRDLVKEVVLHQSLAGVADRQADYRRLITGALGVRDEEVEGLLQDICSELEEAGEGHVGAGIAAAVAAASAANANVAGGAVAV